MQQDQHASTPPPPAGARGGRKPKRKSSFGKLTPGQAACARWAMGAPADDLGRDDSHDTPCEETECSQADGCSSHSRQSSSLKLFSPGGVRSRSGNRSVARRPQEPLQRATGNRIISLDMIHAQLCPVMQCPVCRKLGTLVIGLEEEEARGLAGILKFVCSNCEEVTEVQLHTSPMATAVRNTVKAGKNEGKNAGGRFQSELNLRAALAAAMCGFGELGLQKLCGVLNMPALSKRAWAVASDTVEEAMITVGIEATQVALKKEFEAASFRPVLNGRTPIHASYDMQWFKPGRAFNAPDGCGTMFGALTRKVISTAYRTKVGTLQNHSGSSGSMEPACGAECVLALNQSRDPAVMVTKLCLDLDAKTPAAVKAACEEAGFPVPVQCHDPNHYVKTAKAKFLEVKKTVKINKCFDPQTQTRLAKEFSQALHQHRKSNKETLRGALLNVLDHAFNIHSKCLQYFQCPIALGKRTHSYFNVDGTWLDETPNAAAGARLRPLLDDVFQKLTTDAQLDALLHDMDTQICEAFNGLHASMRPKRLDLSRSKAGKARHLLAVKRYNEGIVQAARDTLACLGISLGQVGDIVLAQYQQYSENKSVKQKSIEGKTRRCACKEKRKRRDDPANNELLEYGANIGFDELEREVREASGEPQPPAKQPRKQYKCTLCGDVGHNRVKCPKKGGDN